MGAKLRLSEGNDAGINAEREQSRSLSAAKVSKKNQLYKFYNRNSIKETRTTICQVEERVPLLSVLLVLIDDDPNLLTLFHKPCGFCFLNFLSQKLALLQLFF